MRQERFLSTGDVKPEEDQTTWFVPMQLVSASQPNTPSSDVLNAKEQTFNIANYKAGDWVKINYESTGFFRTNYDSAALKALGGAIKQGHLTKSDRVGLVSDVFALS